MDDATKFCHHCSRIILNDCLYVGMSAKQNNTKTKLVDVSLDFHMNCFVEIAGDVYAQALHVKIGRWIDENRQLKKQIETQTENDLWKR